MVSPQVAEPNLPFALNAVRVRDKLFWLCGCQRIGSGQQRLGHRDPGRRWVELSSALSSDLSSPRPLALVEV
ncbi:hypothetical protein COO55_37690 [Rhodococcus opacus]|nr:hypothetical protein COO55_00100 [Rhodococcus opacus]RKM77092.1 hypothetical protein COO55_37690 [Rhodococcus opacus]